jgi:hypothetical protein
MPAVEARSRSAGPPLGGEADRRPDGRWLVAILSVAALLRFAWALYATQEPTSPIVSGDPFNYFYFGQEIAAGRGYVSMVTGEPTAYYPVGYPALLAALFWFVQHSPVPDDLALAATMLNVVLSSASVALVYLIARHAFGVRTGLLAAFVMAIFPNPIYYVATLQLETVFIFLTLVAVSIIATHDWRTAPPSQARLLLFGCALGLSAAVRPFSLPMLLALASAVAVTGMGWRMVVRTTVLPALAAAAVLTPWAIRNLVVMDAFIPFSSNGGDTLCMDRGPDSDGQFAWADHEGCASAEGVPPDEYEAHQNAANTRLALRFIVEHPGQEVQLIGKRAWHMLKQDHDGLTSIESGGQMPILGDRSRQVLSTTADLYYFIIGGLALAGLVPIVKRRSPVDLIVIGSGLVLLAVPLLLWGNPRFHLPVLPFLAIAAAVALANGHRRLVAGRSPPS